jgi:hypothetical protein
MVKIGDRIELIALAKDPRTKQDDPSWNKWRHKGDLGIVQSLNADQIGVKFDDGGHLFLLKNADQFKIL